MYDPAVGRTNMLTIGDFPFPILLPEPFLQGDFRILPPVSLESYDPDA